MRRNFLVIFVVIVSILYGFKIPDTTIRYIIPQDSFLTDYSEPILIGIVSENAEKCAKWYIDMFDMELIDRDILPDAAYKQITLRGHNFFLEITEKQNLISKNNLSLNSDMLICGFNKIGIAVDGLSSFHEKIKTRSDNESEIIDDPIIGTSYFYLYDNDGNRLQIFEARNRFINDSIVIEKPILSLLGISVMDLNSSIEWYEDNLGFRFMRKFDISESGTHIILLRSNQFTLELDNFDKGMIEREKIESLQENQELIGINKFTLEVEDINNIQDHLSSNNVNTLSKIVKGRSEWNKQYMFVNDSEGNLIQLIQR